MYKRTISYTDFDGNQREEDFYFHFSKAELLEMEHSREGGLQNYIERIYKTQDGPELMKIFKELILRAYGEKSLDGKRFVKSHELSAAFSQTEAYSILFMELATDDVKAAEFINNVIPSDMQEEVKKLEAEKDLKLAEVRAASAIDG